MLTVILDDESEITSSYAMFMKRSGIADCKIYNDPVKFVGDLNGMFPAVLLLDLQMPMMGGEQVLEIVKQVSPKTSVVILTGNTEIEPAVRCMQKGALDYIVKPIDKDRLAAIYANALNAYMMKSEIDALRTAMRTPKMPACKNFCGIITSSSGMLEIFTYIEAISRSSFPVLITGETGVGKELFARAVHTCSGRKGQFVAVNVSGLDDSMFSDTLFGHVKGAFTNADKQRKGLIAEAEGGTLFLDEIGDLAENTQIKLLRILQEKTYMPLGADKNIKADVRIVTATNSDLSEKVRKGSFRQDLLYRLSTHSVVVPPLRERQGDIPILANLFYKKTLKELGVEETDVPETALEIMSDYSFPGNVRQIQAIMADMAAVFAGKPTEADIPVFLARHGMKAGSGKHDFKGQFAYSGDFPTLKQMEQYLVDYAVHSSDGNVSHAAKMLGITRQALHKRLKG